MTEIFKNLFNRDFNEVKSLYKPMNVSITNKADENTSVIDIQGYIGRDYFMEWITGEKSPNTIENLKKQLRDVNSETIIVNINSEGGSLNDALLIKNMLESKQAKIITNLYGFSASAATVIHMAGSVRRMPENGAFMLIHRVMFGICGHLNQNSTLSLLQDQETIDNDLVSMYAKRSNATEQEIIELMDAGEGYGKWIDSNKALELGFVDELFDPADEDDPYTDHLMAYSDDDEEEKKKNMQALFGVQNLSEMNEAWENAKAAMKQEKVNTEPAPNIELNEEDNDKNVIAHSEKRERELQLLKLKLR